MKRYNDITYITILSKWKKKLMKTQHLLLYLFSDNFGKMQPHKNIFHILSKWHSTL